MKRWRPRCEYQIQTSYPDGVSSMWWPVPEHIGVVGSSSFGKLGRYTAEGSRPEVAHTVVGTDSTSCEWAGG